MDTSSSIILVNLHIIGVQKAGTTALSSFLNQHPDIYLVDGKEAHVFDDALFAQQKNKKKFADAKYKSKLTKYKSQPIICDATPITIFRPEFLKACYQYNPQAKFIVVLRDPVERAVSQYYMEYSKGYEKQSMLSAFLLEPFRQMGKDKSPSWQVESPYRVHSYLSRGCYSKQLKNLYCTVPKNQVLVLQQQDLQLQHHSTMQQVFEFLRIEQYPITPKQVFRSDRPKSNLNMRLAKWYARIFYFIKSENPKRWRQIIKS